MNKTENGQLHLEAYSGYGGKYYDSVHYSKMFNASNPHHFGMQVAKVYSASNRYRNKKWTAHTLAAGNVKYIGDDIYRWTLAYDDCVEFVIQEFLEVGNAKPGLGNSRFRIAVDKPWLSEPDVIHGEDNSFPGLEIKGIGQKQGDSYIYDVELQSSDDGAFIDPDQLAVGRRFSKVSTSIYTEMNDLRGGDFYEGHWDLECQIGAFGEEFKVSDKVIRKEMRARKRNSMSELRMIPKTQRVLSGFAWQLTRDGKKIPQGMFVTDAEDRLNERIEMDREWAMEFGTYSVKQEEYSNRIKRTGPGFRQLVLDGWILPYNGILTYKMLEDYIYNIVQHRNGSDQRKIVLSTGEGGIRLFNQILADKASTFTLVDSKFVRDTTSGFNRYSLAYGAQFTKAIMLNGVEIMLLHDPMKDDKKYCKQTHPHQPQFTIDSFRFDIYDFGTSDGDNNICMVQEEGNEYYATHAPMIDIRKGQIRSGEKVPSLYKGFTVIRETTGSLWIKDVSRIGSIIYNPYF